jgi:tetratricopeptide (TPR) repeat protein
MIDWFVGYSPPPEKYKAQVEQALKGIDTFQSLSAAYAKDPKNVEVLFKLAGKQDALSRTDKAAELYKQIVALDPEGKAGAADYQGEKASYTELAEFNLGLAALVARPPARPDPEPLRAFTKKYPDARIVKDAYLRLSSVFYLRAAPQDQAAKFYEEYVGRFPQDVPALSAWVQRIIQDKWPIDKGIELALKAIEIQKASPPPPPGTKPPAVPMMPGASMSLNLGRLYALKGDKAKALETVDAAAKEIGDNARMIPAIAQAYLDIGAEDKALAIYGPEFLKKNIGNAAQLGPYASFWTRQEKNLESALEAAKKAVELAPDNPMGWTTLGNVYLRMKNAAEAVKAADKAVEVAPAAQKAIVQRLADQIKSKAASIK